MVRGALLQRRSVAVAVTVWGCPKPCQPALQALQSRPGSSSLPGVQQVVTGPLEDMEQGRSMADAGSWRVCPCDQSFPL